MLHHCDFDKNVLQNHFHCFQTEGLQLGTPKDSLVVHPHLLGFRISLSREGTISRDEIKIYVFALTWRDQIEIIIRPFSYFETTRRLRIDILVFRDEIETFENHFSLSSEKK